MKFSFKAIAAAALLAIPSVSQAQFDTTVPLSINSFPYPTVGTNYPNNGTAGGFLATFTIDFPNNPGATFSDYLVWCIDPNRTISVPGGPYNYWAFTAEQFAQSNYGSANGHDVTVSDMQQIVGLVGDLSTNWNSYNAQQRADRQGSIWATFRGEAPVLQNIPVGGLGGWLVLFNNENQSFVTYVPEPSESALLLVGFAGLAAVAMKRRRTV